MTTDWQQFLREVSWFLGPGEGAELGEPQPWTRGSVDSLPQLSVLFDSATLTPVSVDGRGYELVVGGAPAGGGGGRPPPPHAGESDAVPEVHRDFWTLCGGIVERFGEPETWWLNQNEVLTVDAARVRIADALGDYAWLWHGDGLALPINPDEYYAVAVEANGNLTLAHRRDGGLVLFAPDHAFDGVTPLAGCPPYSLLTIDDVPDLATWIEVCADTWRRQ